MPTYGMPRRNASICLSATVPAVAVLLARLSVTALELNPATSAKIADAHHGHRDQQLDEPEPSFVTQARGHRAAS